MYIFMDESGSFAPVEPGQIGLSVVGALVIPEAKWDLVERKYRRIRLSLPKDANGEVKGRLLSEAQVDRIVRLLAASSCLFEATIIDMGRETPAGLEAHRDGQVRGITANVDNTYHPNLLGQLAELQDRLRDMPLSLYVQSVLMRQTIAEVLNHAQLYFVQRWPKDLANFHWVIDSKHPAKVTDPEDWWKETLAPLLQSHSLRNPMHLLEGADYSYFLAKYDMPMLDHLRHLVPDGEDQATNIKALIGDSFRFSSDAEPGLELVDVVTNATRRALKGNLGFTGWAHIPHLMVRQRGRQALRVVTLSGQAQRDVSAVYAGVVRQFGWGQRAMLTSPTRREE